MELGTARLFLRRIARRRCKVEVDASTAPWPRARATHQSAWAHVVLCLDQETHSSGRAGGAALVTPHLVPVALPYRSRIGVFFTPEHGSAVDGFAEEYAARRESQAHHPCCRGGVGPGHSLDIMWLAMDSRSGVSIGGTRMSGWRDRRGQAASEARFPAEFARQNDHVRGYLGLHHFRPVHGADAASNARQPLQAERRHPHLVRNHTLDSFATTAP
jgi:hypothetical protein